MDRDRKLEEIPSSDDDDMDASELRGRLQKLSARGSLGIESPEYTSPIGSPPDEDSLLNAKGRFMELKRMMQEDKKSRKSKRKARKKIHPVNVKPSDDDPEVEGFEEIPGAEDVEDWEREGSISPASYTDDVDQLLESFRSERASVMVAGGGDRDRDLSIMMTHNPRMMEVCQQLRERDANILTLEGKVMELDRQVIDLQDTLSEKEKLLNSKNDAVSCMVTQYQVKLLERDSELGRTQETLFELEKKFGTAQNQWKAEKDQLNSEVKSAQLRIQDLEDTNKLLENSRVETTSRDIELEEKLLVLKEDRDRLTRDNVALEGALARVTQEKGALEEGLSEKKEVLERRVAELETALTKAKEEGESKLGKMKKQFALKLKSVKESATAAAAAEHPAEQSGNSPALQELQTQLTELKDKLAIKAEETEMLQSQNTALQNELEGLKVQLSEASIPPKEDSSAEFELLHKISNLENQITHLELQSEEKSSQLSSIQDQLATLSAEKSSLESDCNTRLGEYEANFTRTIEEYEERLEGVEKLEKSNAELKEAVEKGKEQLNKMKKQFQAKLKAMREGQGGSQSQGQVGDTELQSKIQVLEQRLAELEEEKGNNLWISEELAQIKQEKEALEKEYASVSAGYQEQIQALQSSLEKAGDTINQLESLRQTQAPQNQELQQSSPESANVNFFTASETESGWDTQDGWESQTRITALEHQVASLEEEKGSGFLVEEDVGRLHKERETLEKEFLAKSSAYETKIQDLEQQLTKSTEQLAKMKRQFQHKLRALRDENSKGGKEKGLDSSSASSSPCPETEAQLQEKIINLENRVAELEEEKGNRLLQMIDFDEQQAQLTKEVTQGSPSTSAEDVIRLEITLAEKEEELRLLQHQLTELTSALNVKNVEVESLMKTCSDMEASLQQNIEELGRSISTKDEEINSQLSGLEVQLSGKDGEIQSLQEKLLDTEMRFEEMRSLLQEYQGMVDGARGADKEELSSLKLELESIRAQASSAEQSFTAMKEHYATESATQVTTITDLQSQLTSLTQNYTEQATTLQSLRDKQGRKEADFLSQIETLSSQLASYETEIETLKSAQGQETEMQTVDLFDGGSSATAEFEEKERQLSLRLQELMDELSSKNEALQALNWQLENARVESESTMKPLQEEVERLRISLQEYVTYSEGLKTEMESCRGHYASLESSYNQIYMEFTTKTAALEELQGEITTLRSNLGEKDNKISELVSLNSKLTEEQSSIQTLISTSNDKVAQLEAQVVAASGESGSLRAKLTSLTNEYIQLRENLEAKDSETLRLRQDADALQSDHSQSSSELKIQITSLMDQLTEYENEISLSASRLKESDELCSEARAKLEQLEVSLQEKAQLLGEKEKALEVAENGLFEKSEECLRLEEKLRESGEKHRLEMEAHFVKYSNDLETTYDQLALSASENLLLQGRLREKEEELGGITARLQVQGMTELESQAKELRIVELETQVRDLAAEVAECKSLRAALTSAEIEHEVVGAQQIQNLWGPPPPYEQGQGQSPGQDPFANLGQSQGQNVGVQVEPAESSSSSAQQEGQKDARIYELEVQLAELQISLDDANLSIGEVPELKASLEILSYRIKELEDENSVLKKEVGTLKQELSSIHHSAQSHPQRSSSEPPAPSPDQSSSRIPVQEPLIVPSTAYVTTNLEGQSAEDSTAAFSTQLEASAKEIKELKVKNGKMIQRFKQLKDKYDALFKENEGFKSKKEFSLDSAFEDEFMSQVTAKEALLEEKGKLLGELGVENKRLLEKIDLLERGTERLTEMKEEQDRQVQGLTASKRMLETEISALKWKMEELENISLARVDTADFAASGSVPGGVGTSEGQLPTQREQQNQGYFDMNASNSMEQENSSLRQQNFVLSTELESLRVEIDSYKKSLDELHERNQQLEEEIEKLQELQIDARVKTPNPSQTPNVNLNVAPDTQSLQSNPPPPPAGNNHQLSLDSQLSSLQLQLASESQEKVLLQRKIELLQGKISEIEVSEIKCFEESLMLKGWTRQLELDNLKIQHELERIYASIQEGSGSGEPGGGSIKVKVLQDEVLRLVDALQDRDRRCEQLTVEITRLLEERDTLQLKLSNVLRHNVSLHEEVSKGREPGDGDGSSPTSSSPRKPNDIPSYDKEALKLKLAELEDMNYSMGIDLRREREARRLVQEQLFFSSSSRNYPGSGGGGNANRQASPVRSPSRPPPPVIMSPMTPSSTIPPPPSGIVSSTNTPISGTASHSSTPHQHPHHHDQECHDHNHDHSGHHEHNHDHEHVSHTHSSGSASGTSPSPIYSSPSYDLPFQQPDFQSLTQSQKPQDPIPTATTPTFPIPTVDVIQPPMMQSVPVPVPSSPPQNEGSNVTPSSPPPNPSTQHLFNI